MSSNSSAGSGNDNDASSTIPTEAMMIMLSPDGYYTYLNIPKPSAASVAEKSNTGAGSASSKPPVGQADVNANANADEDVDLVLVKKNYRRLSIRHHPDKPNGDVETFRLLTRAKVVLSNPKLRKQYDMLGVDLHDESQKDHDDDGHHHDGGDGDTGDSSTSANPGSGGNASGSQNDSVIQEIASMCLTTVLTVAFRTCLLAIASLLVVRYQILLFPALAFMAYVAYKIHSTPGAPSTQIIPPLCISVGLIIMYQASHGYVATSNGAGSTTNWVLYWLGESMVVCIFIYNSIPMDQFSPTLQRPIVAASVVVGVLAALWFRGSFWNYAFVILLEGLLALFIAVAFPIFEMLLEAVVNEKLKKVGEKVRHHHSLMEKYYSAKSKQ
eukprot:CAMPEP_0113444028 /NCGR_PEP_ID=MMETSP0014_2-20120614/2456_1 /TAXON_ID=2857 /ORGANISM="Nitzschia sp." /LENGTH=383 /DNA_ID=CAMNT_0000335029 /DNA_START=42 /DNA_END=1193 /DNA_ORIENTATION=- /assembly_acc=CAM_ASM_000159